MREQLIELDARRRAALGKLGRPEHRLYRATEYDDGTIVFEPAVVLSEHDVRLLARPDVLEAIDEPVEHGQSVDVVRDLKRLSRQYRQT